MQITLNKLTLTQKILLASKICDNQFIPHKPFRQQAHFLTNTNEECFYGGQAGGGKSDALLMAGLMYVDYEDYNGLILRRTLDDLEMPNAILDRAKQWLLPFEDKGYLQYKDIKKKFTFHSGATLTFRYLAHNNDLMKYQGAELQFIGFDELTQFPENQYLYLHSRLRKTEDNPIPLRMRGASNPGGVGHEWVKKRFVDSKSKLPFISSAYTDNKYLNHEEYSNQLDKLDELTRQQLKFGNWDAMVTSGLLMNRQQFQDALIEPSDFQQWQPSYSVIGIDPASTGTDKFAMALLTYFTNGKVVLVDLDATSSSNPEYKLIDFIIRNQKYQPRVINIEREAGSSPHFALNYWNNLLSDLMVKMGFYITDTPASSTGNKYARSYNHAYHVRNGNMFINSELPILYDEGSEPYSLLNQLQNQYIYVHPDKNVMKDYPSPDELDAVSYSFEELQKVVTGLALNVNVDFKI